MVALVILICILSYILIYMSDYFSFIILKIKFNSINTIDTIRSISMLNNSIRIIKYPL